MRTYRCLPWAYDEKDKLKIDPVAFLCILVGHTETGYVLYDLVKKDVDEYCNVLVNKTKFYSDLFQGQVEKYEPIFTEEELEVEALNSNAVANHVEKFEVIDSEVFALNCEVLTPRMYSEAIAGITIARSGLRPLMTSCIY